MKRFIIVLALLLPTLSANGSDAADGGAGGLAALNWQVGPRSESIGAKATLKTNASLAFLDQANSKKFLELTGNLPDSEHNILLSQEGNWWGAFSFDPIGYVKDDEKIDADALLKQLKEADGPANEQRKKLGLAALTTDGWYVPPHYDPDTKRLEWGLRLVSEGKTGLNYTVRLLGRTGVMSATLVSSPEKLDSDVRSFKAALTGFDFNSGERYSEFKQGDRVAEYGLAALVAGGAAAVAAKTGLWKVILGFLAAFWKVIVGVVVAALAGLKSIFKRNQA